MIKKLFMAGALAATAYQAPHFHHSLKNTVKDVEQSVVIIHTDDGHLGAGFVYDKAGDIITAWHVASKENTNIKVTLFNGKEYDAVFLGGDKELDVAILKIKSSPDLKPVKWGKTKDLRQGDTVFVIGHPFGFQWSVSRGIVSAFDRPDPEYPNVKYFQIDAPCNPGNSGAPAFNDDGEVEGSVLRIMTNSYVHQNSGVSFVLPAESIRKVATAVLG